MKKLLPLLFLPLALLGQTNVQKNSSGVISNGPVTFGPGNTLYAVSGATVNFTGATLIGFGGGGGVVGFVIAWRLDRDLRPPGLPRRQVAARNDDFLFVNKALDCVNAVFLTSVQPVDVVWSGG